MFRSAELRAAALVVAMRELEGSKSAARKHVQESKELVLKQRFKEAAQHISLAIEIHPDLSEYYLLKYPFLVIFLFSYARLISRVILNF